MTHSTPQSSALKVCTKCGQSKPLTEYRTTKYGKPNSWCNDCHRAANRASYLKHRAQRLQAAHEYRESNVDAVREKWRESGRRKNYTSPESRARNAVNDAIRQGKLPPAWSMVCDQCDEAQAAHWHHHNGYERAHWLDIVPLCLDCHGKEHRSD